MGKFFNGLTLFLAFSGLFFATFYVVLGFIYGFTELTCTRILWNTLTSMLMFDMYAREKRK